MTGYDKHYSKTTHSYLDEYGNIFYATKIKMPSVNYYQTYIQDSEWKNISWYDSNGNWEIFRYEEIGRRKNGEIIYECIVILSTIRFIRNEIQYSKDEFIHLHYTLDKTS